MCQVRTMVGIMAMDTAQSTGFVGAESLGVLGYGRRRNGGFMEHDFNHGLNTGKFRTSMGGVTDDITQGARICRWRRSRVSRGGLVFGCPLASFSFLSWSCHHRGRVLGRCGGPGGSEGDRLNRCQSKVGFGVTGWGSSWRVNVPDGYAQGQVREREGGHEGDRIDSRRGSQERYLTSGIMTSRDGSKMVKAWGNRPRRIQGLMTTNCR